MFIEHITIQNFGAIRFYDADFAPNLNLIDSYYSAEIAAAIGMLLCSKASAFGKQQLQSSTQISATICLEDATYLVCVKPVLGQLQLLATDPSGADATARYQYALSHCAEQDDVESFDGKDKQIVRRLFQYLHPEEYAELSEKTQHLADTKTFRRYLHQYIQSFRSEPINSQKKYQTAISPQGIFKVFHPEFSGKIFLSETEMKLFLYICFLNVAEFWADFERIRDLHHEKKPLIVRNFIEFLDDSADISGLLARTQKLQRQIILLTSPSDEESKKKWRCA